MPPQKTSVEDSERKRLNFDPTINLGHVLTFAGFMGTILVGWTTLDKRVTVMEQRAATIEQRTGEQESRVKEYLSDLKSDVRDIKRSIEGMAKVGTGAK